MSNENTNPNPGENENTLPGAGSNRPEHASRRTFLKAAIVGSAATVAVGAAGVVGLERAGAAPVPFARFPFLGNTNSPGGSTGSACTTGTNPNDYVEQSTFNNKESIFLWALFANLPAGSYHMTVSPTIEPKGGAICSPSPASHPFEYQGSSSATSNARIYDLSASSVSWTCSPKKQSQLPNTATQSGGSLPTSSVTVSAGDDLQLQIHMKNGCSGARTVTMTVSLFQGSNTTPFLSATTTITINA